MFGFVASVLAFCGTVTASTQVARGVVRCIGKFKEGDPRGALAEAAGGILAPVTTAINQVLRLGEDIIVASTGLSPEEGPTERVAEA